MYDRPPFLRGVYTCFDYNYNPIARRILFVKVSESVARDEFMKLKGQLKTYDQLDERRNVIINTPASRRTSSGSATSLLPL